MQPPCACPRFDRGGQGRDLSRLHSGQAMLGPKNGARRLNGRTRVDIAPWLRGLGLGQYEAVFRGNAIDAEVLPELTDEHLREMGLPLGHRLKLLKAIAALGSGAPSHAGGPIPPSARPAPLARISQRWGCIGALNEAKLLYRNHLSRIRGAPRCPHSVTQTCSVLHPCKGAR